MYVANREKPLDSATVKESIHDDARPIFSQAFCCCLRMDVVALRSVQNCAFLLYHRADLRLAHTRTHRYGRHA